MAVATPAMLPVPMVEARAVESAWSWVMPRPVFFPLLRNTEPRVVFIHNGRPKSWKKPVRTEQYNPASRNSPSSHGFQIKSPSRSKNAMVPPPLSTGMRPPVEL